MGKLAVSYREWNCGVNKISKDIWVEIPPGVSLVSLELFFPVCFCGVLSFILSQLDVVEKTPFFGIK